MECPAVIDLVTLTADERAERAFSRLKDGQDVIVQVTSPRNVRALRWYWALLQKIHANQEKYPSVGALHIAFKMACGLVFEVINPATGEVSVVPDSIRFERMEEEEFKAYLNNVVDLVCSYIIPGLEPGALRDEINEMVGYRQ